MRTLVLALLGVLGPALATGQDTAIVIQPESAGVTVQPQELPRLVAEEAIRLYNAPSTTRLVGRDRKSTRLNSSHGYISYAVFCLKKKKTQILQLTPDSASA